jgi:hypothetical protein
MPQLDGFERFQLSELDRVPRVPGIYAWYAKAQIGAPDWRRTDNEEGVDQGGANLRSLLARHTARFAPPALKTTALGSFRDSWEGRLLPERFGRFVDAVSKGTLEGEWNVVQFPEKEMPRVFSGERQRARLTQLLELASPIFSAPLYIGRADDLNQRVRDHLSELDRWHRAVKGNPAHRDKLKQLLFEGHADECLRDIFATRAVACGFSPDNLEVYVLDIASTLSIAIEAAKDLSAVLEWFLNTWNRPLLGRA